MLLWEDGTLTEFAIGVVVILFAIGLIQHQRESRRSIASKDQQAGFLRAQYWRRMCANVLIASMGIVFVVNSYIIDPLTSVTLLSVILILLFVIFSVAIADFYLTHRHLHPHLQSAMEAKRALLDEADRLMVAQAAQKSEAQRESVGEQATNTNGERNDIKD